MGETPKFHLGDTIKKTECFKILAVVEEGGNISQDLAVEILKTAMKEVPSDMLKSQISDYEMDLRNGLHFVLKGIVLDQTLVIKCLCGCNLVSVVKAKEFKSKGRTSIEVVPL